MRPDDAVLDEEEGAARALGDESRVLAVEKSLFASFRLRLFLGKDGAEEVQRLDVAAQPADVFGERERDAAFLLLTVRRALADRHREVRRGTTGEGEGARCRAARDLEVDRAALDAALFDEVVVNGGEFFVHIGDGDVHFAHGAAEAREVAIEGEELAVVDVRDLVDAVAELIAAVLDVDLRLARCIEMIVEKAEFLQKNGLLDDVRMNFLHCVRKCSSHYNGNGCKKQFGRRALLDFQHLTDIMKKHSISNRKRRQCISHCRKE